MLGKTVLAGFLLVRILRPFNDHLYLSDTKEIDNKMHNSLHYYTNPNGDETTASSIP